MENPRPGGEMKSRDPSEPTKSQLLPLGSGAWQELVTKPYFVPGVVACIGLTLLWATLENKALRWTISVGALPVQVPVYYIVIAFLLTLGGAFAIYRMAGKPKAWWLMPAVAAATAMLTISPIMGMLQQLFGVVGPSRQAPGVINGFIYHFFAAALPEEMLKAIPVAVGVYIGLKMLGRLPPAHPGRQLAVIEPLDGAIIGAASGFGFAFAETVGQYMPATIVLKPFVMGELAELLRRNGVPIKLPPLQNIGSMWDFYPVIDKLYEELIKLAGSGRAAFELNRILAQTQASGLELMVPRLVGNVFGHAAYAGVFGYFIGLAALKPANRAKTLLIGLATACTLHAGWNGAAGVSSLFTFLIAMAAFVMLSVSMIKGRQLSPERSQLVASQVLASATAAPPAASNVMRPSVAPPMPPTPAAAPMPPAAAPMAKPGAAPVSMTWDDDSNQRFLEIGSARIPASVGARLWERQAPGATASRGDGVVAEVSANPNDPAVLGLKNLSTEAWAVTLADGSQRELAAGRSIKLEAGMTLKIGHLVAQVR